MTRRSLTAASRRFGVELARKWGVGFRGLDGHVRAAQDLDQPIRPGKQRSEPLDPETGVVEETREDQTTLRSSVLPRSSDVPDLFALGAAVVAVMAIQGLHGPAVLSAPLFDPLRTAGVLLLGAGVSR